MTAYAVVASGGTSVQATVAPVSFEIRIISVFAYGTSTAAGGSPSSLPAFAGLATSTSGGTALTPTNLRAGSLTASSTCKVGATLSGSQSLWLGLASGGGSSAFDGTTTFNTSGGSASWQPPVDLIISPGEVFWSGMNASDGNGAIVIWFEELRLSWPY